MSKYIDADLLKSKLKDVATELKTGNYYLDNTEQAVGYENALIDFEQIIDSLQQEQPSIPDLDEAAEEHINKALFKWSYDDEDGIEQYVYDAFKAGAKWQYQKDRGEFAKIKAKTWSEGFDARKEQMLKEAVEGEIQMRYSGCLCAKTIRAINEDKFKFGDKVRIIIVKEEKK